MEGYRPWTATDWLLAALVAAVFCLCAYYYPAVAERVPVHWNLAGRVNGWGPKWVSLFLGSGAALFILLLMSFLPLIDPYREGYAAFQREYGLLKACLVAFFLGLQGVLLRSALTPSFPVDMNRLLAVALGLLFLCLGLLLPRIGRNGLAGIRTPWTLASEEVWARTHRFGGKLFCLAGLVSLSAGVAGARWGLLLAIAGLTAAGLVSVVYSYLIRERR